MSYIQDMKSLQHKHYLLTGLFFASTLAPGFLVVFYFKPELVERYDFFKLVLFSMSLTVPYLLVNASQISATGIFDDHGEKGHKAGLALACFSSFYVFFIALLLAYFLEHSFKGFLVNLAVLTIVAHLTFWSTARSERKKAPPEASD